MDSYALPDKGRSHGVLRPTSEPKAEVMSEARRPTNGAESPKKASLTPGVRLALVMGVAWLSAAAVSATPECPNVHNPVPDCAFDVDASQWGLTSSAMLGYEAVDGNTDPGSVSLKRLNSPQPPWRANSLTCFHLEPSTTYEFGGWIKLVTTGDPPGPCWVGLVTYPSLSLIHI